MIFHNNNRFLFCNFCIALCSNDPSVDFNVEKRWEEHGFSSTFDSDSNEDVLCFKAPNEIEQLRELEFCSDDPSVDFNVEERWEEHISSSDISSASDNDSNEDIPRFKVPNEIEQLREFGQRITQNDLDCLLNILRPNLLPTLPKSSKTFMRTIDAQYNIIEMDDANGKTGQFVYLGIKKGLEACVNPDLHIDGKIRLQINADGLPLSKSNNNHFWPLTAKVFFEPNIYEVFVIAIYFGPSKPNSIDEYLEEFIAEINELLKDGILISGVHLKVELMCFICDTPARAFLKNTLGHKGKESCERCEIVGETVERRTVFTSMNETRRTDESFRNFRQARHHHGHSPILKISPPIDMIRIFVLDPMHLFLEGAMKNIIVNLRSGNKNVRLSMTHRKELDRRMEYLASQIPFEFQRKTRATANIAKWKATELRFFLLYCGPVVLKDLLNEKLYDHFLLLHVASRILYSENFCLKYNVHAKVYLRTFFSDLKELYGPEFQTLNAHHLIHSSDDVKNMECNLSKISAFEFESYLGKLKRKLRTPNRPLAQVCRRLFEESSVKRSKKVTLPLNLEILSSTASGEIEKIKFKDTLISKHSPNNMVLLSNNNVVTVNEMFVDNDNLMLKCQIWKKRDVVYEYPSSSKIFNIWNLNTNPLNKFCTVPVTLISHKLVKLQLSFSENEPKKLFVIPFLH